mgnify:CR=1 FL=1|jgi:hypothetical protein
MSYSNDKRRASQEFKRRYASISPDEREKLNKDSDAFGCIIGFILFAIIIVIFILTGDVIGE